MKRILTLITLFMGVAATTNLNAADAARQADRVANILEQARLRRAQNLANADRIAAEHVARNAAGQARADLLVQEAHRDIARLEQERVEARPARRGLFQDEAFLAAFRNPPVRDVFAGRELRAARELVRDLENPEAADPARAHIREAFRAAHENPPLQGEREPVREEAQDPQNWIQRHPILAVTAAAGIVITASLLIDLAVRGEKSVLGQMYAQLTGKNKVIVVDENDNDEDDED